MTDMASGIGDIGKALMVIGAVIFAVGGIIMLSGRVPFLGKLPGDILIQKKNFTFYFPIATSILISIVLTLLFWFLGRR
jgi:hypothetical protein